MGPNLSLHTLVPELNYNFDPTRGDILRCAYESFYDAQLGRGYFYGEPFYPYKGPRLPENGILNPVWNTDGNENVLVFNGISNYIVFPRGSFTLKFEMFMDATQIPQVLFRHFGEYGSICVYAKDNKLYAGYYNPKTGYNMSFITGLVLPVDMWTKVKITYDLNVMKFVVDDQQPYTETFSGRPLYFSTSIFGGHTIKGGGTGLNEDAQYFQGKLKSFVIKHYVEN